VIDLFAGPLAVYDIMRSSFIAQQAKSDLAVKPVGSKNQLALKIDTYKITTLIGGTRRSL
jgi:hypothetical protein